MTLRYVEAKPGEDWRSVSRQFTDWMGKRIEKLGDCGWVEGTPVGLNGRAFLGFHIPDRHTELTALFLDWASANNRLVGIVENEERIVFHGEPGLVVDLPLSEKSIPTPPWLKDF